MGPCHVDSTKVEEVPSHPPSQPQHQEIAEDNNKNNDVEARVEAIWEQMKKGVLCKKTSTSKNQHVASPMNSSPAHNNCNNNWMGYLGLEPKEQSSRLRNFSTANKESTSAGNWIASLGLKNGAGADAGAGAGASHGRRSRVEMKEAADLDGEAMGASKWTTGDGAESKEAAAATQTQSTSAVDAVLEQIRKKPKLSVMEKTKMDWGEFKEENRGVEEELDAYKKSSGQYLDKLSFLQRADFREFERERDARLALQARRRPGP